MPPSQDAAPPRAARVGEQYGVSEADIADAIARDGLAIALRPRLAVVWARVHDGEVGVADGVGGIHADSYEVAISAAERAVFSAWRAVYSPSDPFPHVNVPLAWKIRAFVRPPYTQPYWRASMRAAAHSPSISRRTRPPTRPTRRRIIGSWLGCNCKRAARRRACNRAIRV